MTNKPGDSDEQAPTHKAPFIYDLSKITRGRLKQLIRQYQASLFEGYSPPDLQPEKDIPYQTWKLATDGTQSTTLKDGRTVFLILSPLDIEERYHGARAYELPKMTGEQQNILATLVGMEKSRIEPKRVWKAFLLRKAFLEDTSDPKTFLKKVRTDPQLKDATYQDLKEALVGLRLPEALLRASHPGFDDLPERDRAALLMQVCTRINKVKDALAELETFLERGTPDGLRKHRVADVELDVRAAELRDALSLTYQEIGEIIGVPMSKTSQTKGHHKRVSDMVERGRKILTQALGEARYRAHLNTIKPDLEYFFSSYTQSTAESSSTDL